MKNAKITITDLQRKPGAIAMRIIRGEELILTRNGHDFARLVPIETHPHRLYKPKAIHQLNVPPQPIPPFPRLAPKEAVEEAREMIKHVEEGTLPSFRKCEAPLTNCRSHGESYLVEFNGEEGIEKKRVILCPVHAKVARDSSVSVTKLINP